MGLKFGELRKYISRIDRTAVCFHETMNYETYRFASNIPDKYDDLYVVGFGISELEFDADEFTPPDVIERSRIGENSYLAKCIEVTVAQKPREEVFAETGEIKLKL